MLTMTPIEDAWGIDPTSENSFDTEKKKTNVSSKHA